MKRSAIAAVLGAALSGAALAQSSVTLYGRLNTTVEYQDDGTVTKTVLQNNASRWGLRGNEDLGGGMSAFFLLESGFSSDTGARRDAGMFTREAYVGLQSASLGRLRGGRLLGPLYANTIDAIANFNHDTGPTAEDNFWKLDEVEFSNGVEYTTPSFGGLTAVGMVAAGEGTGNKTWQGVVNWNADRLHLSAGYTESTNPAGRKAVKGFAAAASYGFGPFNAAVAYNRPERDVEGTADQVTVTGQYNFGANEIHLSYGQISDFSKVPDSKAEQYTVGYNYNLSRRTKLYGFYYANKNRAIPFGGGDLTRQANATWSSIGGGIRFNF